MPRVNPAILVWARETAGLARGEAAKKLGIGNSDRLRAFEEGELEPTRKQLVNMSEKYRRPLLAFYLPEPPKQKDLGQDFRTLPEPSPLGEEAILDALIRNVHARQQLIKAALEEADEASELMFVGSATIGGGVNQLVESIRQQLNVTLGRFRDQENPTQAFSYLRSAAERCGIFVLLMGNLGTHHTNIDPQSFRGFALADRVAPFVVINENDSRAAWSFTLLHELAHIWLGQTGISGYASEIEIEKFCDTVAARFLLASDELNEMDVYNADLAALVQRIGLFAGERNLSRKMVAYNLLSAGRITSQIYRSLSDEFDADRLRQKASENAGEGGPNYYVVRRHRIGQGLVSAVRRMVDSGALSTPKAATVLGVKPTSVNRLVNESRAA